MRSILLQSRPFTSYLWMVLKVLILSLLLLALYQQLISYSDLDIRSVFKRLHVGRLFAYGLLAIILMPINWTLENYRWFRLIDKEKRPDFSEALKGTLAGVTISLITPYRTGEFAGRMAYVKQLPVPALWLSNLALLVSTFSAGLLAISLDYPIAVELPSGTSQFAVVALATILLIYVSSGILLSKLGGLFPSKWIDKFQLPVRYAPVDLLITLLLSTARFSVYTLQFWLFLKAFGVPISMLDGLATVSIMFMIQTLLPSLAVVDMAIRGNLALFLLHHYTNEPIAILCAVLTLWLVNLFLPSMAGLYFLWRKE